MTNIEELKQAISQDDCIWVGHATDLFKYVAVEDIDTGRWEAFKRAIIQVLDSGEYYAFEFTEGLTEMQESEPPWGYDGDEEWELTPVTKKTRTVTETYYE